VPVSPRCTLTLLNAQHIEQRLCSDTLQAIEASRATHAFQPRTPRVNGLGSFRRSGLHLF
jgi:hypothetical protein